MAANTPNAAVCSYSVSTRTPENLAAGQRENWVSAGSFSDRRNRICRVWSNIDPACRKWAQKTQKKRRSRARRADWEIGVPILTTGGHRFLTANHAERICRNWTQTAHNFSPFANRVGGKFLRSREKEKPVDESAFRVFLCMGGLAKFNLSLDGRTPPFGGMLNCIIGLL